MSHIGRREVLGGAIENTPGEAKEVKFVFPFLSCSLLEKHSPIADSQAKGSRNIEGSSPVEGKKSGEGDVEVVLDPETAPFWIGLALGDITSAVKAGSKYKHTIKLKEDNKPLTATLYRDRVVDQVRFPYSTVNSLELNFADDVAKMSMSFLSQFPVEYSEKSLTQPSLKYYTFKNANVKIDDEEVKVRELTLTIENNAEVDYAPSDNDVDEVIWKGLRITGSMIVKFEDEVQKTAFSNLTKQKAVIEFTGNDGDSIEITIPQMRVDDWSIDSSNDDIVTESVDFVAEDNASGVIKVEITNTTESYIES